MKGYTVQIRYSVNGNIVGKMVDLESEINAEIDALFDLKREISTAINAVDNAEFSTLLELRYLCSKPWEQIALEMGYDLRWLFRLRQRALSVIKMDAA